ncbi:MAG TPA: hypothetical protein PLX97_09585, partial [Gemmatales bacterium]|nr:hypothetical protein [Gemmatales bacterium]
MDFSIRCVLCWLGMVLCSFFTWEASACSFPQSEKRQATSDPKAIFRQYLEAVQKNDLQAAIRYWVLDEEKPTKALEVIVGMMISMRKINLVAERKLGAQGLKDILKGWWRDDVTDAAIDQTRKDLESALVRLEGDNAELIFTNPHNRPTFMPSETIHFRMVKGQWKLDANKMSGLKPGDSFFAKV